jgi:GT2 family glycosyltransferase
LAQDCVVVSTGRNAGYAAGFNAGLAMSLQMDSMGG